MNNLTNNLTPYSNGRRLGSLLSWDPLRLFDELNNWEPAGAQAVWTPYVAPAKLETSEDGATITVDMPGVDAADVELTFEDGQLTIIGKRGERVSRYAIALGDAIDPDRIEAQLDKGVLTVHAHKKPEAKPRKIQIETPSINSLGSGGK
jgi:HSP20 family protein